MYCHIWDSAQVAEDKQTWRTKTLSSEHQQSMQNIHNVFWPKNNQVWNSALTGLCLKTFQHKGLHQFQKKKRKIVLQALSCPVWKCNYISVSIRISTVRCRKPDTSSLSGAKLAFGSVMSELLDSSSAGILPSFLIFILISPPRPVSSHIAAAVLDEASHPTEHCWNPVLLSLWQPVTHMHPIPSLLPLLSLYFPFAYHFLECLQASWRSKQMTYAC